MPLLRHTTFLLLLAALALCARGAQNAPAPYDPARWQADMEKFAQQDRETPPAQGGVLFVGSSSIRLWKTLAADFPGVLVLNRGFGGSRIADSTLYFERLVMPSKPRLVVFFVGGNDINGGHSAEKVAEDFRAFCARLHSALPEARLIYISIPFTESRWEQRATIALANQYISAFCNSDKRLTFVDANSKMLTPEGKPRPELYRADKLHLNTKGYAAWAQLLRPLVNAQWKPQPSP